MGGLVGSGVVGKWEMCWRLGDWGLNVFFYLGGDRVLELELSSFAVAAAAAAAVGLQLGELGLQHRDYLVGGPDDVNQAQVKRRASGMPSDRKRRSASDSRSTVAAQQQHSHSTATAQLQHSGLAMPRITSADQLSIRTGLRNRGRVDRTARGGVVQS